MNTLWKVIIYQGTVIIIHSLLNKESIRKG